MAKLKFSEKNGEVYIVCRLIGSEMLNEPEYRYFIDNRIKGWLVPSMQSADKLVFTGAHGVPLIDVLKSGIDKTQYFQIVSNLLNILEIAEKCGFNMQNIVLDPNYIIIDRQTKEIHLFYLPLWYNESTNDGIVNCLRKISTYASYRDRYDYDRVDSFMNFIISKPGFSIYEAKNYIHNEAPELFALPDRSEFSRPASQSAQQVRKPKVLPPVQHSGDTHEFSAHRAERPLTPATQKSEPKVIPSLREERKQGLPDLVKKEIPHTEQRYPTLTRRSTGVTVNIDKPVFRIGKERSRVDFCVTENRTVSRLHATIYTRSGSCFIEDNNSTNKTYINGTPLIPEREIKLKSGDVLKLSNEEFDFTDR
ncbi:MAG: FHA domain-containing protein [Ruminococcus sp.]|uniref:FHA domain-containing protein n=1 Tax=Ruminococcus sp. TaxID=41978 RepID=UPI001B2B5278|nr:FHA domain-containing protein [Ruminococcus sp.]MBO7473278.1 FHA domain-containing protein [Ruminococcus sp.]MBP5267929.1 FHA domain-containing protein [Ruminococcus sp.]